MSKGGREGGLLFERLVFFSDAVFAIAITLLVLDLRLPPESHGVVDFSALAPKLLGFGLSFSVIGIYWLNHHRLFGTLQSDDRGLRIMNLVFLASVVFLPFPTSVIAEYRPNPSSVSFYALSVCATGLLFAVLTLVARRSSLLRPTETLGGTVQSVIQSLCAPLVFLASLAVVGKDPVLAMLLWWLIIPAMILFAAVGRLIGRRMDRAKG